jgi:negative regulator of flagellin synthesis FlgM
VRHDRIETVRQAIIDGSYDTAAKLEVALDRLLDEL